MTTLNLYAISSIATGISFSILCVVSCFWISAFGEHSIYSPIFFAFYSAAFGFGINRSRFSKNFGLPSIFQRTAVLCLMAGVGITFLKAVIRYVSAWPIVPVLFLCFAGFLAGTTFVTAAKLKRPQSRLTASSLLLLNSVTAIFFIFLSQLLFERTPNYQTTLLWLSYLGTAGLLCLLLMARDIDYKTLIFLVCAIVLPKQMNGVFSSIPDSLAPKLRKEAPNDALVVSALQSRYHRIVFTEERGENPDFPGLPQHVLYVGGKVKFSSREEQTHHACLVNVPMLAAEHSGNPRKRALVLGGGEGLIARNLLSIPRIESVTVVEKEAQLIQLAQNEQKLRMYHLDSLRNPKVSLITSDPYQWLASAKETYDVIIVDTTSSDYGTFRLTSAAEFYRRVIDRLTDRGIVALSIGHFTFDNREQISSDSPLFLWKKMFHALGVAPHFYDNPKQQEGFLLVTKSRSFVAEQFFRRSLMTSGRESPYFCRYQKVEDQPEVPLRTVSQSLRGHYGFVASSELTKSFRQTYRGPHAIFLPK